MQHYNNRESVLAAVQQNGLALRDAAIPLKGDREVVLAAVQQDVLLKHAGEDVLAHLLLFSRNVNYSVLRRLPAGVSGLSV